MENEKQTTTQSNLYPTAPTGDPYPPPYTGFQSPPPGGVAYPQAPPHQPAYLQTYPSAYPHQPYGQGGYSSATQQSYGQAGYPTAESGPPAYGYPAPGSVGYGQPQQVVIMPQNVVVPHPSLLTVSMIGAIILSCFAFWCCGCLFGLVAFILAMVGQNKSSEGKVQSAIQLRNASYGVSIAGIVITIIFIIVIIVVLVTESAKRFSDLHN